MTRPRRWLSSVAAALYAFSVNAQVSETTCEPESLWTFNSRNQSPCVVASYLQGACIDGDYNVLALPPGFHYSGPSRGEATDCQCSTITYSLMTACSKCQGRVIPSWGRWSAHCASVHYSFPMETPEDTDIPDWAYTSLINDFFNMTVAKQIAAIESQEVDTTATVPPTPTRTSSVLRSSSSQISTSTRATSLTSDISTFLSLSQELSTTASTTPNPSSTNTNVFIASRPSMRTTWIAVGLAVAILFIALALLLAWRRHRGTKKYKALTSSAPFDLRQATQKLSVDPGYNALSAHEVDDHVFVVDNLYYNPVEEVQSPATTESTDLYNRHSSVRRYVHST